MSMMRLGAVSLDCADPGPLATFWADLLGGEVLAGKYRGVAVVRLDNILLSAMQVDDYVPPTWPAGDVPKQGHFDVEVDDLDEAERHALALGAVRAEPQPDAASHLVLLDPAGHPFCLSLTANFPR